MPERRHLPLPFLAAAALAFAVPQIAAAQAPPPSAPQIGLTAEQSATLAAMKAEAEAIDKIADPRAYRTAYEAALAYAATIYPADHPQLAIIEGEIDFTYFVLGQIDALPPRLERALAIFQAAGPDYRDKYIETVNNLGVVNEALGRNDIALQYQRRALELWREDAPPEGSAELVQGLNNLAWSLRGQGDVQQAYALSEEALAIAGGLMDSGDLSDALVDAYAVGVNNQSIFLIGLNRDAQAAQVVRAGVVRVSGLLGADHPRVATLLLNGAVLLVRTGQFAEAETMARRALDIREAAYGPEAPTAAEARLNLILALNSLGRYADALPLAEYTVERLVEAQGDLAPQTLEARARLATIHYSLGQLDQGIEQIRATLDGYQAIREPGHEDIEWYSQVLALQLGRAARWDEAIPVLAELEHSRMGTPDEFAKDHAAMLALRAAAEGKVGDAEVARAYLDRAEPALIAIWRAEVEGEGAQGRPDRFTDWAMGWLAVAAGDIGELERSFNLAQYVGVGASERSLLRAQQRERAGDPEIAAALRSRQDLVEQRESQLGVFQAAASSGDAAAAAQVNAQITRLDAEILAMSGIAAPLLDPQGSADLQPLLAADAALMFVVGTDIHTRIYVLTNDGLVVEDSPRPTLIINNLVQQLRDNLDAGTADGAAFDTAAAQELYRALFTNPVLAALAGREQISVIARGELAKLPFSILMDEGGTFALERYAFAYPIEMSGVGGNRSASQAQGGDVQLTSFLGIGAPSLPGLEAGEGAFRGAGNSQRVLGLGTLGLAEGELQAMATAMQAGTAQILSGPDATEAAMRAQDLSSFTFLTFATHGLMAGELAGLNEAALVLSPPLDGAPGGSEDDGLLTTSEIASLHLAARWVILSACNSASGNGQDEEAFGGLAQAFLYAGAQSLLASHWRVRDDAAARLTVATARGAMAGMSPAQALRQAKLDLMHDDSVPLASHPAIWAPFVFVGG